MKVTSFFYRLIGICFATFASFHLEANALCCKEPKELIHCRRFAAHLDLIYWKANEDGLEYATKMIANPIIGQSSTTKTKLHDLHFNWDPGFSLGFGYLFEDWALNINWTRIHNSAQAKKSAAGIESQVGNVDTLISPWVNLLFELRAGALEAKAHWHLKYNTLDLEFEKSITFCEKFVLSPFFAFRAAWIHQDYQAKYDTVFLLGEHQPPFNRVVVFKGKNDFTGFGLREGIEMLYHFNQNWHLFSQLAGNLLYGKFSVLMKNLDDQGLGEGGIPPMPLDFKASENFWRVRLSFEEMVGFGWQRFFQCEKYRLLLRAGYELSQWLNQNELYYTLYFRGQDTIFSVPIRSQGDLSFHGFRISSQLDF